jgi:hypothetical protein
MTVRIFGNGGDLFADNLGNVYDYDPSEEAAEGDHDGYADVVFVDLVEWLAFWDLDGSQIPECIDILDIDCTLRDGTVVKAEPSYRAILRDNI